MRTDLAARSLCALAAASLAVLGLAYRDFAPAWRNFPDWVPDHESWIEVLSLVLLTGSIGLLIPRTFRPSLAAIGVYCAVWAFLAAEPILAAPLSIGAWYGTVEALSVLCGVALIMPKAPARVARSIFGLTCIFYGVSHFAFAGYTAAMVPAWLPGPVVLAYFTGLCHMGAGIALVAGVLPRLAASLEAGMMSLFGLLVWVPSFLADPTPKWATPAQNQWSELVVTLALAASAWIVSLSSPRDKVMAKQI